MNYADYAQQDSFIGQYMRYMSVQETPLAYDFWCACWAMSNAIGRRHPVLRPRAPVYMNMYLLLVAESGTTRKSSAVNAATRVVRRYMEQSGQQTAILDGRMTAGLLVRAMIDLNLGGHDAQVALSISELAATIGRTGNANDLSILLTDLYDCPDWRRGGSTTSGQYEVRRSYLSLVGASTRQWLQRAVSPNVIEGGFTSRCIFVASDARKRKIAWPEDTDTTEQVDALSVQLRQRRDALDARGRGGIPATTAAIRRFTEWYNSRSIGTDAFRSSFDGRADAHVLRVAGCLAFSDRSFTIEHRHVEQAIALVVRARSDGAAIFSGSNEADIPAHVRAFDRLRNILVEAGRDGLAQARITLAMSHYADSALIVRILEAMHELDMVQRAIMLPDTRGGRKKTIWRATKLIHSKAANDIVKYLASPNTVLETKDVEDNTGSAD